MDDISGQIGKILSDPNSMAQIQSIMNSLGAGGQGSPQQSPSLPPMNSFTNQNNNAPPQNTPQPQQAQNGSVGLGGLGDLGGLGSLLGGGGMNMDMMAALSRLAPIMGKVRQEDNSTRLLLALKPMLSESRRGKVDEAMRILQLIRLFPLLKNSGILSSLLGGII